MPDPIVTWLATALAGFGPFDAPPDADAANLLRAALEDPGTRTRLLQDLRQEVARISDGRVSLSRADFSEFTFRPREALAEPMRLSGSRLVALVPADAPLAYDQ
ncbi:hypothetical protein [Actinoplanes aureus]|uniref:Uncharacterized protein n=1 Tax=Actinoplanes aureus TaxID=2792083 RepID=A0A931CLF8_9ACTN|nr:hypothetical protein [Actinoplanes aureus]MBG0568428.1 hypothetical protein [Actinoplanes aureus]